MKVPTSSTLPVRANLAPPLPTASNPIVKTRVLLVDDHPITRQGMRALIVGAV
ncbi:MAG: hypothetical protein Q7S40_20915 [Opitutaceae bacterium]|nr:hypothetical protein [Opitutaceae bacterium]